MPKSASPRMARFKYFRGSREGRTIMVLAINDGPKSEIGKYVNVPLSKADLPMLRQMIEAIERES